jgi:hypothetical protein
VQDREGQKVLMIPLASEFRATVHVGYREAPTGGTQDGPSLEVQDQRVHLYRRTARPPIYETFLSI